MEEGVLGALGQLVQRKAVLCVLAVLVREKEMDLRQLWQCVREQMDEEELREVLWLCAKRGWLRVQPPPVSRVAVELDALSRLCYAEIAADFLARRFDALSAAVLRYLLAHRASPAQQLTAELGNLFALSGGAPVSAAQLSEKIAALTADGLLAAPDEHRLLRLDEPRLFALLRAELILRFYAPRLSPAALQLLEAVLSCAAQPGAAPWVAREAATLYLLRAHPQLFRQGGVEAAAGELRAALPNVFELCAESGACRLDAAAVAAAMQAELLEAHVEGAFSAAHLRVFRAALHLGLRSSKAVAEQVLLPLRVVVPALYDLEAARLLCRPNPTAAPDDFRPNAREFRALLQAQYWAVFGRMSARMLRGPDGAPAPRAQRAQFALCLRLLAERLFVLREL